MRALGLTGGIGMGKSTADQLLRERGIAVIDTDLIARQIVEPGQPALREIAEAFGSQMIGEDGQLRRGELARRVFPDAAARKQLEEITHPRIREVWHQQIRAWRAEGKRIGVVVIPLLFETGAEAELEATICIACSAPTQRKRLETRGWTSDQIEQRIQAQLPIETKMAKADYVVWSEGPVAVLGAQLAKIV